MALSKAIRSVDTDPNEDDEVLTKSRERDDDQRAIDADAERMTKAWEAAGKPGHDVLTSKAGFKAADKQSYVVGKDDVSAVKGMIRRASSLHKVEPIYAKNRVLEDGDVRIKWTVGPRKVRARTAAATETPAATPATTPDETPDTGTQDTENPGGDGRDKSRRRWGQGQ